MCFNYKILQVEDVSKLKEEPFSSHRRLRVFSMKGCKCVNCKQIGVKLMLGKDKTGNKHWDLYCEDGEPMTVDHAIPVSKGGSNHIDNLQPMCRTCNTRKGNGDINEPNSTLKITLKKAIVKVGDIVYTKTGKRKNKPKLLGKVISICENPHNQQLSVVVEEKPKSFFNLNLIYKSI